MSTNLTIDDSSADIAYSSNWAPQSDSDLLADEFFQSTYHSAQSYGATANISFTGSGVYLYGSKGPDHGNYSVQFDNYIVFLSANADKEQYQQQLFSYEFSYGTHFLSLTALTNDEGRWLDLDFVTITVNNSDTTVNATSSASSLTASQTITPPWLNDVASSSGASTSISNPSSTSSSTSDDDSTSGLSFTLAIVFGSILAAVLLLTLVMLIMRWRKRGPSSQEVHKVSTSYTFPGAGNTEKRGGSAPANRSLLKTLSMGLGGSTTSFKTNGFARFTNRASDPSFMAGPKSPLSTHPDRNGNGLGLGLVDAPTDRNGQGLYPDASPTSRTDPFYRTPTPFEQRERERDGRMSPSSALSLGTTAISASHANAEKTGKSPQQYHQQLEPIESVAPTPVEPYPTQPLQRPMPAYIVHQSSNPHNRQNDQNSNTYPYQPQRESATSVALPNFRLFQDDSKSMAGSAIGTLVPEYTAFATPIEKLKEESKTNPQSRFSRLYSQANSKLDPSGSASTTQPPSRLNTSLNAESKIGRNRTSLLNPNGNRNSTIATKIQISDPIPIPINVRHEFSANAYGHPAFYPSLPSFLPGESTNSTSHSSGADGCTDAFSLSAAMKRPRRSSKRPPVRPKRPGEGLLDWLADGIITGLERSASWRSRGSRKSREKGREKDSGRDSEKSDFLQV